MNPKQVHAKLKDLAAVIARAAESDHTTAQHYARMVEAIQKGAKAHQRFRPVGCPREITLAQETNWFIVRCVTSALLHPNRTARHLSVLRDDYVWASLMVAHDKKRFTDALRPEDCAVIEEYDYPRMNPVGGDK